MASYDTMSASEREQAKPAQRERRMSIMNEVHDTLNSRQREAVLCTEGPLLVIAGAGSGKTRVLTHRIAYLVGEQGVNPWNILAITFTNKAAAEMRERVDRLVENGAERVWVSTFHSLCVRILRRFIDRIGYENNFTIYDADDQRTLMKQILKRLELDPKQFRDRAVLSAISSAKNELVSPQDFMADAQGSWRERRIAQVYQEYQTELKKNNALDFDDLIFKTVDLFREDREVLEYYQDRFLYIMVDEYQDTNQAQFELVSLLARKHGNLCVVGDDDQSIYRFRGADIRNILNFDHEFSGARVIKLEQNYRSTKAILDAANAVIHNNRGRRDKTLWTANDQGAPVEFRQYDEAWEEADGIVRELLKDRQKTGRSYQDYAVLYRTNAQSRLLEEKCIAHDVPYRLVGGVNFYQRKEIKDVLCYLKTIANGLDDLAAERIINVPKRGIGAASVGKVSLWAQASMTSFYEACCHADEIPGLGRTAAKIRAFTEQIGEFRGRMAAGIGIRDLIDAIVNETGYREELAADGETEAETRLENIDELVNKAAAYEKAHDAPDLNEFLEEVALVADVDSLDGSGDRLTLMTLHSAKGLEFPFVFLAGMEDGLFPSSRSTNSDDPDDVEEERRLCYVGITRARERLIMTGARRRMMNGDMHYSVVSRFVEEIPEEMICTEQPEPFLSRRGRAEEEEEDSFPWSRDERNAAARPHSRGTSEFSRKYGFGKNNGGFYGVNRNGDPDGSRKRRETGGGTYGKSKGLEAAGGAYGTGSSFGTAGVYGKNPGFGKAFSVNKASGLDYAEGDRVRHAKFGTGTVRKIVDGTKDFEVTVDFDAAGTKKMFASFARLEKLQT